MPTISQLPSVTQVTAADQIPLSQAGVTRSVSVGALLSSTQPAILTPSGTLLGRDSLGQGGPEAVTVGVGLALNSATLAATGADHAGFVSQTTLVPSDQAVLSSNGQPKLLALSLLRQLFSAGSNVAINSAGTISATIGEQLSSIASMPAATSPSSQDLLAISQGGTDHAISYASLLDGVTIDLVQPAAPAQDSDQFWVAQGTNMMVRQDLSAVWVWIASKIPGFKLPVVELSTDTTLDTTVHNGRILVCSQPLALQADGVNLGSGFVCDVLNLSSAAVTLGGSIVTSSGGSSIPVGQAATVRCVSYSAGTVVHAVISGISTAASPPAVVSGFSATSSTQNSVVLAWVSVAGASSYVVECRTQGATDWSVACSGLDGTTYTVSGLQASTTYDFGVLAVNSAGTSPSLTTTSATTTAPLAVPGQVAGVAASAVTTNSISLTWSPPSSGGAVASYTIQLSTSGSGTWTTGGSGITGTQYTVGGLAANTSYDFQVVAVNDSGSGPASAEITAQTAQAVGNVTSITWNAVPSGAYAHDVGTIGVNVHVAPSTAAVQFGFSTSTSVMPTSWVAATFVNTDLWGAYLPTPATAGTWYVWASGTDGSCPVVYATGFTVT